MPYLCAMLIKRPGVIEEITDQTGYLAIYTDFVIVRRKWRWKR